MDRMISAADMLDWLLDTRDLVDTPAVTAAPTRLITQAPGTEGMRALIAEESRGTPRPLHLRPTPAARKAFQYLRDKRAEEHRSAELGPLAERVWERRAIFAEAPELRSTAAWEAAGERRREQITDAVVNVASDCYAVGQQVAAKNGGTLAKASPATRGGAPVCVIVVLVPGKDGERPRRTEIVVPQ